MNTISSRTPEGEPAKCPICGHVFPALPSKPLLDTTCPGCGCLLILERERGWLNLTGVARAATKSQNRKVESKLDDEPPPAEHSIDDILPDNVIRIARATFEGFFAKIVSIDESKREALLTITVFGRDTPVMIDFADLDVRLK